MKNIIGLLIILLGCSHSKKQNISVKNDVLPIKEIPMDKQFTYSVAVTVYSPYELYINDIAAEKSTEVGANAVVDMNPYMLGNGTHKIRLKLLPQKGKELLDIEAYEMAHFEVVKVILDDKRNVKYDEEIMKLPLPPMPTPLPFVELEWEIEIDDLPYELEGWKNSKVFKKEDSLAIKKQVVAYYEELKTILNNGDAEEWKKRITQERKEIWTCSYEKNSNIKENWKDLLKEVKEEYKANMLPLENYELKFYAGGRILSLERRETNYFQDIKVNIKGWNALIFNDEGSVYSIETKLHMPKGSNSFEIIR